MAASEETGSGPVIRDNRRIDPVTGQVRGKHAASQPAGTSGAGRPAGPQGSQGPQGGQASPGAPGGQGPEGVRETQPDNRDNEDEIVTQQGPEEVLEGILAEANEAELQEAGRQETGRPPESERQPETGRQQADAEARLAERTADLQRLQAEYANYRKRVDRDRAVVREQAVVSTLTGLLPVLDAIDQAREHGELSGGFKSVADSLQSALGKLGLVTYGEKGDPFDPKIHEALTHTYSSDVAEVTCVDILQPGYKVGDRILRPARVAVAEPATGPDGSSNEAGWPNGEGDN